MNGFYETQEGSDLIKKFEEIQWYRRLTLHKNLPESGRILIDFEEPDRELTVRLGCGTAGYYREGSEEVGSFPLSTTFGSR